VGSQCVWQDTSGVHLKKNASLLDHHAGLLINLIHENNVEHAASEMRQHVILIDSIQIFRVILELASE